MTEKILAALAQELKGVAETQKIQGSDIKDLTKAFSNMAVQNEQLRSTQVQVTALWEKFDAACGPDGIVAKIREHQAHCPKDDLESFKIELRDKNKRVWAALGLLATIYATTLVVIITSIRGH